MINPGLDRKRVQEGGGLHTTVTTSPNKLFVGLGSYADSTRNAHFTVGSCQSAEGNSAVPVFDVDVTAGVVRILGQVLVVP